jgi:hypothetical protein
MILGAPERRSLDTTFINFGLDIPVSLLCVDLLARNATNARLNAVHRPSYLIKFSCVAVATTHAALWD